MAQRNITFECGHEAVVQLYGRSQRREWEAERLAASLCGSCYEEERAREIAEENERSAEANRAAGLPALTGSPKQVAWAETIRREKLDQIDDVRDRADRRLKRAEELEMGPDDERVVRSNRQRENAETAHAALSEITDARWFIDNQSWSARTLLWEAEAGRLRPRTEKQRAEGFDPYGLNRLTFPAEEVVHGSEGDKYVLLRLVRSRWEGCTVVHPASMTDVTPDGSLTVKFAGDRKVFVSDGVRHRYVSAEALHADRVHRRDEAGERHYWPMPDYAPGEWTEIDVPEGDVSETEVRGRRWTVIQLTCSRWEGLHFLHPVTLTRRHRRGYVTIRVAPDWQFRLLGGDKMLTVGSREMHEDRAAPLPEPGESLAGNPTTWHTITFHHSRVRRARTGDTRLARFPLDTEWPDAVVLHPERLCRVREDGSEEWVFHGDWRFRLRTRESGTEELTAEEFLAAVEGWAGKKTAPGTYLQVPEDLAPVEDIVIPDDLLEDNPLPPKGPELQA
ncbi:hypothetical protein ACFW6R_25710 [Streptomyces albidoflavus]